MSNTLETFKTKIFADGADKETMLRLANTDYISGLTTNPTLMRQSGITDYKNFCLDIVDSINNKPISYEVFSDEFDEMYRQAKIISSWGDNVYVKIPVSNTKQEYSYELIKKLSSENIKLNVTAIMTLAQVENVVANLDPKIESYISIFAGRIADTGIDPIKIMTEAIKIMKPVPKSELIWASPRELLNIIQANEIGCHIITVTPDILKKLSLLNYNLDTYSLDTVKMFYKDAKAAGYDI